MKFIVSEKIRRETTLCPHDFSCLTNGLCGNSLKCGVRDSNSEAVLFLKSVGNEVMRCPYIMAFQNGYLCLCPTHIDIYRQEQQLLKQRHSLRDALEPPYATSGVQHDEPLEPEE